MTLTRFFVKGELPRDVRKTYLAAVRLRAFQPLDPDGEPNEASGWCVMDRPFDLDFDLDKLFEDRFLTLGFRIDRFRTPAAMIRAQLAEEEQRLLARTGKNRVSRSERQELKDKIVRRLRKKMAPSTRAVDVVWDLDAGVVLFFSHSQRVGRDFTALFEKTFRLELVEDSPYIAAERVGLPKPLARALSRVEPLELSRGRKKLNGAASPAAGARRARSPEDEPGGSDAGEGEGPDAELLQRIETTRFLGSEFLLWIWVRTEFANTELRLGEGAEYQVWLDQQLTLESPLDKNERVTVRGLAPADSSEAREAVRARKLPVRARIVFQNSERDFTSGFVAPRFAIASAKVPAVVGGDASEAFVERMALVEQLCAALDALYRYFLLDRLGDDWAAGWEPAIAAWAEGESPSAAVLQRLARPRARRERRAEG